VSGPYLGALPEGAFGTIYADPPWMLDPTNRAPRRPMYYARMRTADIAAMPVADICLPDAHLWLWTPNTWLPEALLVVAAWGFTYRTMLTWAKPRISTGWWLRGRTEHLIFAARSSKGRRNPGGTSTLLHAPYRGHSVKPVEAYEVIERLSPGPYLELFARAGRPGWESVITHVEPLHAFGEDHKVKVSDPKGPTNDELGGPAHAHLPLMPHISPLPPVANEPPPLLEDRPAGCLDCPPQPGAGA
jgi:N6-adenosine-specific RNA methylase IME4